MELAGLTQRVSQRCGEFIQVAQHRARLFGAERSEADIRDLLQFVNFHLSRGQGSICPWGVTF
jgi:hypothetical protein